MKVNVTISFTREERIAIRRRTHDDDKPASHEDCRRYIKACVFGDLEDAVDDADHEEDVR